MHTTVEKVAPRSLQEWMDREGVSATRLLRMVRERTGIVMSPALFSFILRGSRRCSRMKALALSDVTGVPVDILTQWPRYPEADKPSGRRPRRAA